MITQLILLFAKIKGFDFKEQQVASTEAVPSDSSISSAITVIVAFLGCKTLLEFILTDKVAYITSPENTLELLTFITILIAIFSSTQNDQATFVSIAVLSAFLTYPLYLLKMRVLGVYVSAVNKTLANSLKFFPIFLISSMGFAMTFYVKYDQDGNGTCLCKKSIFDD